MKEIAVVCVPAFATSLHRYNIGVTVSGLNAGNSAQFVNGPKPLTVTDNGLAVFSAGFFAEVFLNGVPGAYSVMNLVPPNDQTCSLSGASGFNPAASFRDFVKVSVACN